MNKRITILSQYFYPEMGAPQTRLLELGRSLVDRGWEVNVITAMPNYPKGKIFKDYRGRIRTVENIDGVEVIRYWMLPSNSRNSLARIVSMVSFSIMSLFSIFHLRKKKSDYIFVESPPLTLGLSGLLLAKGTGGKLVVNISDLWPLSFKELGVLNEGFIYSILLKLEKYIYKKADIITGQSEEILSYILEKCPQKKVHLFRNGVDSSRFMNHDPKVTTNEGLKLVYTGLIGVAQGIPEICENIDFRELNTELHIYGDGPEKSLLAESEDLNSKGIFYHGTISREQIPEELKRFDASLIPLKKSIYGAVPSKIYESMAAGLPIFFSGNGEGASIIQQYDCGWVNQSGNYSQLRENIKTLNKDRNRIYSKKENCLNAAKNSFDRKIQINRLEELLLNY